MLHIVCLTNSEAAIIIFSRANPHILSAVAVKVKFYDESYEVSRYLCISTNASTWLRFFFSS